MRIHKYDGKRYVELGELYHLFKQCLIKADEGTAPGWMCGDNNEIRAAQTTTVSRMFNEIIADDLETLDTPEKIQKYQQKIKLEFLENRYVIATTDNEGKELYLQDFCDKVVEGEETPVFTSDWRFTWFFDDFADAYEVAKDTKEAVDGQLKVYIASAQRVFGGDSTEGKLLNAIFNRGNVEV